MLITNFAAGELSDNLLGRIDLAQYYSAAARIENFDVIPTGGIKRRGGTERLAVLGGAGRLIPFVVSRETGFLLYLTDGRIRVFQTAVVDGKNTVSCVRDTEDEEASAAIPLYAAAAIPDVQYAQNYDTMILCHEGYPPVMVKLGNNTLDFSLVQCGFDVEVEAGEGISLYAHSEDDPAYKKSGWLQSEGKYPRAVSFFNGRVVFAGTMQDRQRVFFSGLQNDHDKENVIYPFATYKKFVTRQREYISVQGKIGTDADIDYEGMGIEHNPEYQAVQLTTPDAMKFAYALSEYHVDSVFFPKDTMVVKLYKSVLILSRRALAEGPLSDAEKDFLTVNTPGTMKYYYERNLNENNNDNKKLIALLRYRCSIGGLPDHGHPELSMDDYQYLHVYLRYTHNKIWLETTYVLGESVSGQLSLRNVVFTKMDIPDTLVKSGSITYHHGAGGYYYSLPVLPNVRGVIGGLLQALFDNFFTELDEASRAEAGEHTGFHVGWEDDYFFITERPDSDNPLTEQRIRLKDLINTGAVVATLERGTSMYDSIFQLVNISDIYVTIQEMLLNSLVYEFRMQNTAQQTVYFGNPADILVKLNERLGVTGTVFIPLYVDRDPIVDRHPVPDCGFTFEIASDMNDAIRWLAVNQGVVVGTENAEWVIPPDVTAANVRAVLNSRYGSSAIQGTVVDNAICFFQTGKKSLVEYYIPQQDNFFRANNMAMFSRNMLLESEALEFDFIRSPNTRLFVTRKDGALVTLLYERGTGTFAWGRVTTEGTFKSVAVLPGYDGNDDVYMAVERGGSVFLEALREAGEVYMDSYTKVTAGDWAAVTSGYDAAAAVVRKDGNVYEVLPVNTPPDWGKGGEVYIGYSYRSVMRAMPQADEQMRERSFSNVYTRFMGSYMPRLKALPGGTEDPVLLPAGVREPFTGVTQSMYPGGLNRDASFEISHGKPTPCRILAIYASSPGGK